MSGGSAKSAEVRAEHAWLRYAGRGRSFVCMGRAHEWGTTVRGAGRACTLSRGAASIVSKITATGPEAAVEQRSATEMPRRRGAGRAFGPRFGPGPEDTNGCRGRGWGGGGEVGGRKGVGRGGMGGGEREGKVWRRVRQVNGTTESARERRREECVCKCVSNRLRK